MDMFSQVIEPSSPRARNASGSHHDKAAASTVRGHVLRQIRREAFGSAGAAALLASLIAGPALAQAVVPAAAAKPETSTVSEIIVTGTRIQTTGFTAPTPTSVI